MNELLFGNIVEKEALENILALNQIKKCDNEIEKYTNEINEQNNEMINILKDNNINEDYIERIHKYKNLLVNMDGDTDRIVELSTKIEENEKRINEFQEKISEVENTLEELKKEIFDTNDTSKVIECQNEIENNNVRLNDLNDILNQLISDNTPLLIEKEYLDAKNNDFDLNVPNFNKNEIESDLNKITDDFNNAISKLELPVRENIEFCQKKISNREIEIKKNNDRKNSIIEAFPNALNLDFEKAFNEVSNLLEELNLHRDNIKVEEKNIFDEQEEKEEKIIENDIEEKIIDNNEEKKEIKDEMSLIDDTEEDTENNFSFDEEVVNVEDASNDTEKDNEINEEPQEEINNEKEEIQDEDVESVSYVLSEGESLANIAEKVYPSKDNWEAIYYFNKDAIDKYLVSNGISNDFENIKELSEDTTLFAGIKLEIPTDYNYKI